MRNGRISRLFGILTLLGVVFALACSGNPPPQTQPASPEAQLATIGLQVVRTADLVLTQIDIWTDQRLKTVDLQAAAGILAVAQADQARKDIRAQARTLITQIRDQVGGPAQALATTLKFVDTAGGLDRDKGLDTARLMVETIRTAVLQLQVPAGNEASRQVLAATLGQLTGLLQNLALLLPVKAAIGPRNDDPGGGWC